MTETTAFELIAPERLVAEAPVQMVVVPCSDGDVGVLPGHTLLAATVRPGVIDVHEDGKVTERFFVSGGFLEVTPVRCTVLADEAAPVDAIDRALAEQRLADAKAELEGAATDEARQALLARIRVAEAMLAAAAK